MTPTGLSGRSVLVDKVRICAFRGAPLGPYRDLMAGSGHAFDVVWEIEPPLGAEVEALRAQLDTASAVASKVLVPDNHTGRATVSSIAVAREVRARGLDAIACLNARDRNLLGLHRDLLTCSFEGIDELLLVYGDEPSIGARASDLTVRAMVEQCREHAPALRLGVTTRLAPLPAWKQAADALFVQVAYDLDELLAWRDRTSFAGPVHPAVMVIPSTAMAHRLAQRVPELRVPASWLDAIDRDPGAGVDLAVDLVERIAASDAFDGVHLISGRLHRSTAERLAEHACAPRPAVPA
jgi:methylenetetrahydrofolate reductase (NADPH)